MAYEQKDNTFSMFKNKKKEKKEQADLSGTALLDGKEYWINGWKKTDKNGDTYVNGTLRPKDGSNFKEKPKAQTDKVYAPDDSDIPF